MSHPVEEPVAADPARLRRETRGPAGHAPPRGLRPGPGPAGTRRTTLAARGEPYVWLTGSGLAAAVLMIAGLLALVLVNGALTFWPRPLAELTLDDGSRVLGEVVRQEAYRPSAADLEGSSAEARREIAGAGGWSTRRLVRVGNYDLTGEDFVWVEDHRVVSETHPGGVWLIERREWGPAIGRLRALRSDGRAVAVDQDAIRDRLPGLLDDAGASLDRIRRLERDRLGAINDRLERYRLAARRSALDHGEGSPQHREAAARAAEIEQATRTEADRLQGEIAAVREEIGRHRLEIEVSDGGTIPERPGRPDALLQAAQVVRAYPANDLGPAGRLGVYLDRWAEFLTSEPREANTEGGVFPAIFGTLMMTVMMSLAVAPFGIMAALYLREYARQGALVSSVRIAVNNLAGVPSIVYGVFGLGFFCYTVGGGFDAIFYPEKLPSPTFGTGGILWASLTLALLTVPVVIVATEEAIAAVPRSMREGSFACGASKWQTIRRIVLPRATPGIMTGLILAMARGAGEVAPLMITGVVKLAPDLPIDGRFPFLHLERSFMHLGFHIYDVGFQSRNSEAGKPMVFTTTLLLIVMIALLNLGAIALRARLRRRFRGDHF